MFSFSSPLLLIIENMFVYLQRDQNMTTPQR
nr:MAG TPA: hypothetical protein [Caudoviricetes sp.]